MRRVIVSDQSEIAQKHGPTPTRCSRPSGPGEISRVPVKSVSQQALVAVHRVREQWMTTRTARINVLGGLLREQGILLPQRTRRGPVDTARTIGLSDWYSQYLLAVCGSSGACVL
jgi:hypothetical protein